MSALSAPPIPEPDSFRAVEERAAIPYRIRIGVTGHRKDLPDPVALHDIVRRAIGIEAWSDGRRVAEGSVFSLFDVSSIRALRSATSTPLRFSIHTGLAEGADRIVAHVLTDPRTGAEDTWIQAVLPFPPAAYERTFEAPGAIEEFQALLARDPAPTIVAPVPANLDEQKLAYLAAGKAVVDGCDVLIAIWNGLPAQGRGGTAEVIDHAIAIERPIIIIRTDGALRLEARPFKGLRCPGVAKLDRLNSQPWSSADATIAREEHIGKIKDIQDLADTRTVEVLAGHMLPLYARASTLASSSKTSYSRTGLWAYILSSMAILLVMLGLFIDLLHVAAFIGEFVLLTAILVMIKRAHQRRYHQHWLEYRYLTERCRAAIFFFLFNIRPAITRPIGDLKENADDEWVVRVFEDVWRSMERARPAQAPERKSNWLPLAKSTLSEQLVLDQIGYHAPRAAMNHRKSALFESLGQVAFFVALGVAAAHIGMGFLPHTPLVIGCMPVLTVFAVMLPVIAAAMEGFRKHREYARLSRVNKRMVDELKHLDAELHRVDNPDRLRRVMLDIDRSLMRESNEWLGLMVDTDVELTA